MKIKTTYFMQTVCMVLGLLILSSCGKRNVDREIQRFKSAQRDPAIIGIWQSRFSAIEFTADGQFIPPNVQQFYFYTENQSIYTLFPGNNLRQSTVTKYRYHIDSDTLMFDNMRFIRYE